MNAPLFRLVIVAAAAASLAACSGHGSTPIAPVVQPTPTGVAVTTSTGSIPYGQSLLSGAVYLGHANLREIGVDAFIAMRDEPGLLQYARDASDPHSATYRHWLTPQQLGDRFGAPAATYTAVVAALNAQHLAVKSYPQRQMLRLRGAQADIERALGTTFGYYRRGTTTFVAPATAPKPSSALHITALGNAVSYTKRHRNFVPVRVTGSFVDGYAPQQIANAFDYTGAYNAGYRGDGISIGIIGTGPITDGDPRIGVGDYADFKKLYSLAGAGSIVQIADTANVSPGTGANGSSYSTGLATPPPVTSPTSPGCQAQGYSPSSENFSVITDYTTCNPEDLEAQLDTEQAAGLAPNATVNFYIAYNPTECNGVCGASGSLAPEPELGISESDDEIQQAIADNKSDVISMSFGLDEYDNAGFYYGSGSNNFGLTENASLLSEGIAIFVSSGDSGAEGCTGSSDAAIDPNSPCVAYPATDPSVVSVGGVNTPLDDSGRLTGPMTGWGVQTQNSSNGTSIGGSGGGCSVYFQAPTYETTQASALCNGTRTQPDISLDGDTNTGVAVVTDADPTLGGRGIFAVGGTSVAAPEMAAMWGLVLEACKNSAKCVSEGAGANPYRLGNPNTTLYPILSNAASYATTFSDVQFGNNALPNSNGTTYAPGYSAGVGYDLVTGIGVPYARNLITYVVGV